MNYYSEYKKTPTESELKIIINQYKDKNIKDACLFELTLIENSNQNLNFYKNEALKFCKNQKIKNAIESSIQLLEIEDYDKIKKIVSDATQLEIKKDLGLSYEKDIENRINTPRYCISTGYPVFDAIFDGGWGVGELAVVCGTPSVGKTFTLINFAERALRQNKNVFYYSLELSEKLISKRFDALISKIMINDITQRAEETAIKVQEYLMGKFGKLRIKQFPTRKATVSTIENHISSIYRNEGIEPDLIIIDYADIMKSSSYRGEKRHEQSSIYEELRGMSVELNKTVLTASQANKEALHSEVVTMANLAESYNKAAIADIVIGYNRQVSGEVVNYGRAYIAKNRACGRDGQVIPIVFNTSLASVDYPYEEEYLEKIRLGLISDIATPYFNNKGVQLKSFSNPTSPNFNKILKNIVDSKKEILSK